MRQLPCVDVHAPLLLVTMLMLTLTPLLCSGAIMANGSTESALPNATALIDELAACASTLGDGAGLERATLGVARLFVK